VLLQINTAWNIVGFLRTHVTCSIVAFRQGFGTCGVRVIGPRMLTFLKTFGCFFRVSAILPSLIFLPCPFPMFVTVSRRASSNNLDWSTLGLRR
jgi:hypothetical protein